MTEKVHGKNGLIYIGGTVVQYSNSWSITITTDSVEVPAFGDTWKDRVVGLHDWSGSIGAWHDQDSQLIQAAAIAGITYLLAIYPKRSDLSTYYSGNAIFGASSEGSMDSAVTRAGDFVGAGALALTGFS